MKCITLCGNELLCKNVKWKEKENNVKHIFGINALKKVSSSTFAISCSAHKVSVAKNANDKIIYNTRCHIQNVE